MALPVGVAQADLTPQFRERFKWDLHTHVHSLFLDSALQCFYILYRELKGRREVKFKLISRQTTRLYLSGTNLTAPLYDTCLGIRISRALNERRGRTP